MMDEIGARGKGAAVVAPSPDGKMVGGRAGTNRFTGLPDPPDTPGKDAMCLDPQAMTWAQSWMAHGTWIMFAGTPYAPLMINQVP